MKSLRYFIGLIFFICVFACEKYNTPTPLVLKDSLPKVGTDEYYANLRAYKKSDHAICFGWWNGSGGSPNSNMSTRYVALPDSIDIISLWGGLPKDEEAWKELRYCQEVKGTRFVNVMFGSGVDKLMRKNFPALVDSNIMLAIDAVALSLRDTIDKYKLDGFDLDYEPSYGDGGIFGHGEKNSGGDIYTQRLFKALSQYFGPKSGTGKLLIIDGENERGIIDYIDYLVQQAYDAYGNSILNWRYNRFGFNGLLPSKKFVVTENMQKYGGKGRPEFTVDGVQVGSTLGMAYWNPPTGRKGGFGGYIIDSDFASEGSEHPYYYLRKGIQIQNPAIK